MQQTPLATSERRNDIDWLRALAMLAVFVFHCARFFNDEDWHVRNPQTSFAATVFIAVTVQWMMPLFFVLSGISSYHALDCHKVGKYVVARVKRLLVPLLFGIFVVIAPLQVYLERISHSQFKGSFWQFYPHYFEGWFGFGGNFAWMGVHLWYLEVLFVYSLLMLPLFLWLKRPTGVKLLARAAAVLKVPGCIFLLAAPIAIMEFVANTTAVRPTPLGVRDFGGWSLLPYIVFFILGYIVAATPQLAVTIERQRLASLVCCLVVTTAGFYLVESGHKVPDWLVAILRALVSWSGLMAILGFGSRYLNFSNRLLKYANQAVLPFYILHQTIILSVGYFVVQTNVPILVKYLIIAATSFVAIIALYELLIRRINILRFLFGMKLIRPAPPPT
jgi:peptidoglycan/LPS O-acetylase OafA/YrhL